MIQSVSRRQSRVSKPQRMSVAFPTATYTVERESRNEEATDALAYNLIFQRPAARVDDRNSDRRRLERQAANHPVMQPTDPGRSGVIPRRGSQANGKIGDAVDDDGSWHRRGGGLRGSRRFRKAEREGDGRTHGIYGGKAADGRGVVIKKGSGDGNDGGVRRERERERETNSRVSRTIRRTVAAIRKQEKKGGKRISSSGVEF
ncbi:hypothetical protein Trydic_g12100 [Trypoxylus dichotomus]